MRHPKHHSRGCWKFQVSNRPSSNDRPRVNNPRSNERLGLDLLWSLAGWNLELPRRDLLRPGGTIPAEIFTPDGRLEIDAVDIGQGAEPCQDVGELLGDVLRAGVAGQGTGQLADLLAEPHPRPRRAAGRVGGEVPVADVLLKGGEGERLGHTAVYESRGTASKEPRHGCAAGQRGSRGCLPARPAAPPRPRLAPEP